MTREARGKCEVLAVQEHICGTSVKAGLNEGPALGKYAETQALRKPAVQRCGGPILALHLTVEVNLAQKGADVPVTAI